LQIQQVQALSGGCINAASLLNTTEGDYFVKWNKNVPDDLFLREADCLKALAAAKTDLIIPEVFLALAPQENYPGVLLTEYLPPAQDRSKQDEILGRGLAQLHQFTSGQFGFQSNTYCGATLQNNDHVLAGKHLFSNNSKKGLLSISPFTTISCHPVSASNNLLVSSKLGMVFLLNDIFVIPSK